MKQARSPADAEKPGDFKTAPGGATPFTVTEPAQYTLSGTGIVDKNAEILTFADLVLIKPGNIRWLISRVYISGYGDQSVLLQSSLWLTPGSYELQLLWRSSEDVQTHQKEVVTYQTNDPDTIQIKCLNSTNDMYTLVTLPKAGPIWVEGDGRCGGPEPRFTKFEIGQAEQPRSDLAPVITRGNLGGHTSTAAKKQASAPGHDAASLWYIGLHLAMAERSNGESAELRITS